MELQITKDSVSVLINNTRKAYSNSPWGRAAIIKELPDEYMIAILSVWGDIPRFEDPEKPFTIYK